MAVGRLKKDRVTTSGNTASRPSNPEIGDTFYNGVLASLEIYDGSKWIPASRDWTISDYPPQTPTIGTATASSTALEATVTWTLGSNGGKALSAITITPYLNGTTAGTPQNAATTNSTSHTFTGLAQASSYTFKVKATNANGDSAESIATNSITIVTLITVDYLVVAGGGGGGSHNAAGGGAGGMRSTVTNTGGGGTLESAIGIVKGTNYTVTVGSGGAGGGTNASGSSGANSVFATITSTGGGGGGGGNGGAGASGGSGGGGSVYGAAGARTASPVQGFAGGAGNVNLGGGGGGAGQVGGATNAENGVAGNGGNGLACSITGSSVTYAGGGGGSADAGDGNQGAGGAGGGAAGKQNTTSNATANTGGGGGAENRMIATPGAGGSGIVILRWLTSEGTISVGAGLTADATGTDGSYSYKRFTAGSGNVSLS